MIDFIGWWENTSEQKVVENEMERKRGKGPRNDLGRNGTVRFPFWTCWPFLQKLSKFITKGQVQHVAIVVSVVSFQWPLVDKVHRPCSLLHVLCAKGIWCVNLFFPLRTASWQIVSLCIWKQGFALCSSKMARAIVCVSPQKNTGLDSLPFFSCDVFICRKNEQLDDKVVIRKLKQRVAELEAEVERLKAGQVCFNCNCTPKSPCQSPLFTLYRIGLVRITSWHQKFSGSHFALPLSFIHRITGPGGKMVWTMMYSHKPHSMMKVRGQSSKGKTVEQISRNWHKPHWMMKVRGQSSKGKAVEQISRNWLRKRFFLRREKQHSRKHAILLSS